MHFYPAYKLDDVLNMYASAFALLLEEAIRIRADNYVILSAISKLANASGDDSDEFVKSFMDIAQDPRDIINSINNDEPGDFEQVKEILGE